MKIRGVLPNSPDRPKVADLQAKLYPMHLRERKLEREQRARDKARARKYRATGMTFREIAGKLNVTSSSIMAWCKQKGA